jgi:diguanylate cyclase (GGDEF)-like protein
MELVLWRWSTALQITSLVIITAFFAALVRSTPRDELRWWLRAWMANLVALSITLAFWYFDGPAWTQPLVRAGYLGAKTTFVWLFLQGAWSLVRPGGKLVPIRYAIGAIAVFAAIGAFLLAGVNPIGVAQQSVTGVLFMMGAVFLARSRDASLTWLAAGLALRSVLAIVETAAYAVQLASGSVSESALMATTTTTFLSASSSLDTAAEWLLALGGVLAISDRAQRELRSYNQQLLDVQENLRRLIDRDPLTALANRRALPEVFRFVQPAGATLLFFDLDDFKQINDLHGHATGDQCLKRFAIALRESFRPDDAVIRFAGDEFLVVARGLSPEGCEERVNRLRERLRFHARAGGPQIRFSVGVAQLPPGGKPEVALEAADQAMYRAKKSSPSRAAAR